MSAPGHASDLLHQIHVLEQRIARLEEANVKAWYAGFSYGKDGSYDRGFDDGYEEGYACGIEVREDA